MLRRVFPAAVLIFAAAFASAAAQAPKTGGQPPAKPGAGGMTTSSGVYTSQQAMRGEMTYMNLCVGCHAVGTYAAPAFRDKWNGVPLSQLFDFLSNTMPKNDPGSLEPDEYAQVIAYILRANGAPMGKTALPSDLSSLRKIRIDLPRR